MRDPDVWLQAQDWEQAAKGWLVGGPAYTLFINDHIIGCGGLVHMGWKRAEAWLLLSGLVYDYPRIAAKAIIENFNDLIKEHKLKRIQALVHPDFVLGKQFIERLGFEAEGTLRAFGPNNEDLIMYARIENGRSD